MQKRRVVIAEDHALFRDGLHSLIRSRPELEVVGEAGDGLKAIRLVGEKKSACLILGSSYNRCAVSKSSSTVGWAWMVRVKSLAVVPNCRARVGSVMMSETCVNLPKLWPLKNRGF